jgi:hypothetical protein
LRTLRTVKRSPSKLAVGVCATSGSQSRSLLGASESHQPISTTRSSEKASALRSIGRTARRQAMAMSTKTAADTAASGGESGPSI